MVEMATQNMNVTEEVYVTSKTSENTVKTAVIDLYRMEPLVFIWLATNAEKMIDITKLRGIVNYLRVFNNSDACINYITNSRQEKVVVIDSSLVSEQIIPLIDRIDQIDEVNSIYIYSPSEAECAALRGQFYRKVRAIFFDIDSICKELYKIIRRYSNNLTSISSIPSSFEVTNSVNSDQMSLMYSQLIRDLFLVLKYPIEQPEHAIREMIQYFTLQKENYAHRKALLDEMECDYYPVLSGEVNTIPQYKSIWWYTRCSFIYKNLNKALRTQDIDMLFKMRFFIVDLHKQLQDLHSSAVPSSVPLTVYRGQTMSSEEFEKHRSNIGGLMSMNSFLSTSTDKTIADMFATTSRNKPGMENILFEIEIDSKNREKCPFANIAGESYFKSECEVLISMGSVFRIRSMEKDINSIWNVRLTLTDEEDKQVKALADGIWQKIESDNTLFCLAKLMRLMGNYEKAEMFIDELMSGTVFCRHLKNMALVINEIGLIYEEKGDLSTAMLYYQNFIEIKQKRQFIWSSYQCLSSDVSTKTILNYFQDEKNNNNQELNTLKKSFENERNKDHPDQEKLSILCEDMAEIYKEQENDIDALRMYEEHVKLLTSSNPLTMRTSSVIALLYAKLGNMQASEKYVEQTLKEQINFRPHSKDTVESYERIAFIYEIQGRYIDAINMYERVLSCPTDENLTWNIVLPNIGRVYEKQGNYLASLQMYERLLNIQLDRLYPDHPLVADTYASIAHLLDNQHKYEEAYTNLAEGLRIDLITMSPNHPWIKKRHAEIDLIRQKIVLESIS